MAIEQILERLAYAIERQGDSAAVKEIIAQRDKAREELAAVTVDRDRYKERYYHSNAEKAHLEHRVAGYQGAIKRMRRKTVS